MNMETTKGAKESFELELVSSDSKPDFSDNSSTMLPEHCVLLAPGPLRQAKHDERHRIPKSRKPKSTN